MASVWVIYQDHLLLKSGGCKVVHGFESLSKLPLLLQCHFQTFCHIFILFEHLLLPPAVSLGAPTSVCWFRTQIHFCGKSLDHLPSSALSCMVEQPRSPWARILGMGTNREMRFRRASRSGCKGEFSRTRLLQNKEKHWNVDFRSSAPTALHQLIHLHLYVSCGLNPASN